MVYFSIIRDTRLGNWLFQYATALSLSDEVAAYVEPMYRASKGEQPFGDLDELLAKYPELFSDQIPICHDLPVDVVKIEEKGSEYSPLPKIERGKNYRIRGYFQSEKYFDEQKVRTLFAMSAKRKEYLWGKYGEWLSRPNVTGISVKRTNYLQIPHRFPFVNLRYYRDCIAQLPECRDFIVCSDDIPWCKRTFPRAFPDKNFLFVENEKVLDQLYIHTLCKNNIIPNSTFSWWGAWLNDNPGKKVFMPTQWYGFGSHWEGRSEKDIYFKNVIRVKNHYTFWPIIKGLWLYSWNRFKITFYPAKRFVSVNILGGTH